MKINRELLSKVVGELKSLNLISGQPVFHNTSTEVLTEEILVRGEGEIAENGALVVKTGKFTGRSPQDRYIVKGATTENTVWWGDINKEYDAQLFDALHSKMVDFLSDKELYVRDAFAGADANHKLSVRVVGTKAWHSLFCKNMFIDPSEAELENFTSDFLILVAPEYRAIPEIDGTRADNFTIINMEKKIILIGGSAYSGEIKKSVFSVLNFLLPHEKDVLSMHCSANEGEDGDTAVFFGLSGTGKTTLSADPSRYLIGDDEHGWGNAGVFNFEGGCYAKVINITEESEPTIFQAIKPGAIVENTMFNDGTKRINYKDTSITQNTRVSYPLSHIAKRRVPSTGTHPDNIFFLTCDAFGVLPPIAKLTPEQTMYHFMSGYTAKVAGTEVGIVEPQAVFSACFGAPFMPLHPVRYARMLAERIREHKVAVWMVNTGWTGGDYREGSRIALNYTREMINQALTGGLANVAYEAHDVFNVMVPKTCPNIPSALLDPKNTWSDKVAYDEMAEELANMFVENFKKFEGEMLEDVMKGGPQDLRNAREAS